MSDKPSFSQVIRFCLSYKFFPFIPFLTYIVLPSTIQTVFVVGKDSVHPFYVFDIFLLLFLFIGAIKNRINRQSPDLIIPIFLYVLFAIFSAIVNDIGNLFIGLHYHLEFILYAFLFRYAVYDKKEVTIVLLICKFLIIYLSIQVILIFFGFISFDSGPANIMLRGSSTAGSPNATGHILYLLLVVSLFGTETKIHRLVLFITAGIAIIFTLCRGAILGFALFFMFIFLIYELHTTFIRKITYALFVIGLLLSLNNYFHFTEILEARQEESLAYSGGDDYTAGRYRRWHNVFEALSYDNAYLFGEGHATTPMNRGEVLTEWAKTHVKKRFSPHNVYLGVLVETGIISLFIFMIMLIKSVRKFYIVDKYLFIGILVFYGVSFMTEIVTYTQNYAVLIWFAYYNFHEKRNSIGIQSLKKI